MIDPLRNLDKAIIKLINQRAYFVIHAARQSGKTTLLKELVRRINREGKHYTLYCTLEKAQTAAAAEIGIPIILNSIYWAIVSHNLPNASIFKEYIDLNDVYNSLQMALTFYCRALDKPLIIFFDEADCLGRRTLIPFLRQLRSGYDDRADIPFVHTVALTGMRNIRDYRDEYRKPEQTLGDASPFNVITSSMTLPNFTRAEIEELYGQHTADTGQAFSDEAVELAWRQTQGQPWLVNAIAYEITANMDETEPLKTVNADMVSSAIHALEGKRDTHFDSLIARLHEDRVRKVIEPVIIGKEAALNRFSDDYSYVKDLGLIRDDRGKTEPANPIYADIIIRTLNNDILEEMGQNTSVNGLARYMRGGVLDMDALLRGFQAFWRENSDIWVKKYDYQEAAPQLILQAYLQRVINGGGHIVRELAAGTGRADLCAVYEGKRYPVEMKIRYSDRVFADGIEQILGYMDLLGCDRGWLVVFDRRGSLAWEEKIFARTETVGGKTVGIYGC